MIAFVLSGAGNRGPLQAGALQALVEEEIVPEFIVGTSAGAINASYVAAHGLNAESAEAVGKLWESASVDTVYPGNLFTVAWRIIRKENSLYSNHGVRQMLRDNLPSTVTTFGDLALPLYVTATDLLSSRLFVFGEDGTAPIMDAVLGSASVPIIHSPVNYLGLQLVDGGTVANVAASFAMEKGAKELYVINASYGGGESAPVDGIFEVATRTLSTMIAQSLLRDLDRAREDTTVDLHHIYIPAFSGISSRDFSKTKEMVEAGYNATKAYLAAPRPMIVAPMGDQQPGLGESVSGAREYIPPYLR